MFSSSIIFKLRCLWMLSSLFLFNLEKIRESREMSMAVEYENIIQVKRDIGLKSETVNVSKILLIKYQDVCQFVRLSVPNELANPCMVLLYRVAVDVAASYKYCRTKLHLLKNYSQSLQK